MLAVGKPTSCTPFLRWRWKRKFPILGLNIGETYSTDFNEIPETWYIFWPSLQLTYFLIFRFVLIWVASIHFRHFTQGSATKNNKKNTTTSTTSYLQLQVGQLLLKKQVESDPFGLVRELPNKDSNPKRRSHPDHVFSTKWGPWHGNIHSNCGWSQKLWTLQVTPKRKPLEMIRCFYRQTEESDDFVNTLLGETISNSEFARTRIAISPDIVNTKLCFVSMLRVKELLVLAFHMVAKEIGGFQPRFLQSTV